MQKKTLRFLTIIFICSLLFGCAKPVSCETLAERFVDALMHADGEAALSLMPEEMPAYLSDTGNLSREDIARSLTEHFQQFLATRLLRHGPVQSYACRIKRFRDYPERELARLNSCYQKYCFTADAAKELTIVITLTLKNGEKFSVLFTLEIFRIGRDWYTNSLDWMCGNLIAGSSFAY